jgi:hypothetical protein
LQAAPGERGRGGRGAGGAGQWQGAVEARAEPVGEQLVGLARRSALARTRRRRDPTAPKPEIRPSPQVLQRAADRDADLEAAD